MISIAIVDSGPLVAVANRGDPEHTACRAVLEDPSLRLVVPALCVAEVTYLLGRRQGPAIEASFLRGLKDLDVRASAEEDWERIGELVERYADFPLGGVDASVVALAERLEADRIVTLDHRHFSVVEKRGGGRFDLVPEPG